MKKFAACGTLVPRKVLLATIAAEFPCTSTIFQTVIRLPESILISILVISQSFPETHITILFEHLSHRLLAEEFRVIAYFFPAGKITAKI
jgi:hypothetical protein